MFSSKHIKDLTKRVKALEDLNERLRSTLDFYVEMREEENRRHQRDVTNLFGSVRRVRRKLCLLEGKVEVKEGDF